MGLFKYAICTHNEQITLLAYHKYLKKSVPNNACQFHIRKSQTVKKTAQPPPKSTRNIKLIVLTTNNLNVPLIKLGSLILC